MGTYSKHSDEYKTEAVKLIRSDGWSYRKVAQAADVTIATVRNWVKKSEKTSGDSENLLSREELQRKNKELEKENKQLKMERDFAKKVAAWFAKEENQRDLWQ